MTIYDKLLLIYKKYYICTHCLGRVFALLASGVSNLERGNSLLLSFTMENHRKYFSKNKNSEKTALNNLRILAEKAKFIPAQRVLENEGCDYSIINSDEKCYLCNDIFLNLQIYINKAKELVKNIEFNSILVGTSPDSEIINREDKFKAELNLLNSESFKSHFNRVVGKIISTDLNKTAEFSNPDILFLYKIGFKNFDIELIIKSVFIAGRYNKLIRGIPQTHWMCRNCQGKGCESCNFSGKQYDISVEELITPEFFKETQAIDSKFHGAGREDIDVRMLGTGRPFILELKNPKVRTLDLDNIETRVNQTNAGKIKICDLRYSNKKEVIKMKSKAETSRKTYNVLVESEKEINLEEFNSYIKELKEIFEHQKLNQRTAQRVSHRRADIIRKKTIFRVDGQYLKPNLFEFVIETQGGTYVKELINGDEGRTNPSFTEIFKIPLVCKELDVINVDY
ncbi:MAG: tRNA pseudouridine(54/55) synthase Pus10 [Promethearchaeota archaeon]|nr:MAG: tRNA pseudouridine(54/55) synthase Pus10 [Candidatus Lokiarchaeota archaeon]